MTSTEIAARAQAARSAAWTIPSNAEAEGRTAAINNVAAYLTGRMSDSEFAELLANAETSRSAFGPAYVATVSSVLDLVGAR